MTYIIFTDPGCCHFEFSLNRTHDEIVKDNGFSLDKTRINVLV